MSIIIGSGHWISILFLSLELIWVISATTTTEKLPPVPTTTWGTYGVEMTTGTSNTIASVSNPVTLVTDRPMMMSTSVISRGVSTESVTEIVMEENTYTGITFGTETLLENFTETATEAPKDDGECPEPTRMYVRPGDAINITSPRWPRSYLTDLKCYYYISATDGGFVKLTPLDVETELNFDFLTYGNGYNATEEGKMYRLTGTETPGSIFGSDLWLLLESDETVGRKGFLMRLEWTNPMDSMCVDGDYTCYHDDNNETRSCWHPGIECDSHHHCPDKSDEHGCNYCGESHFDVSNGGVANITSPRYPEVFRSKITCEFTITAMGGGKVILEILKFALLGTGDIFIVGDGLDHKNETSILLSHKNNVAPPIITSTAHHMWLSFATDGNKARNTWFFIQVRQLNETVFCNADEFACNSGTECIFSDLVCDGIPHCLDYSDELTCDLCTEDQFLCSDNTCIDRSAICNGEKSCPDFLDELNCVPCGDSYIDLSDDMKRIFSSPLFPERFPTRMACIWLFTADEDHRILVNTSHFEMHQDYVTFGEDHNASDSSSVISRRHGGSLRQIITTRGNRMWITFEAQPSFTVYTGFSMEINQYKELDDCDVGDSFLCSYGLTCVKLHQVCDGNVDCPDLSDESGCDCEDQTEFMCPDKSCITQDQICDGSVQCPDFTDERHCRDVCGWHFRNLTNSTEEIFLQSARWPSSYYCNTACLWQVSGVSGYRMQIEIMYFIVNPRGDEVSFGNGLDQSDEESLIATLVYRVTPGTVYLAEGHQIWLTHTSLCTVWYYGGRFQIMIRQRNSTEGCGEGKTECKSGGICLDDDALCDGVSDCPGYSDEADCEKCGDQEINLSEFNVGYNLSYPLPESRNGRDCVWFFTAAADHRISITFELFVLYKEWQSYVSIGSGHDVINSTNVLFTRVGGVTPKVVTSIGTRIWIVMQSNSLVNDDSFRLVLEQYQNKICDTGTFACPSGLECINSTSVCDGVPDCPEYGDEIGCGSCSATELQCTSGECVDSRLICDANADCISFTDERNCAPCGETRLFLHQLGGTYILQSPGYPIEYPHLTTCVWFVTASPDHRVVVTFLDFNTEEGYDFFSMGYGHDPDNASYLWFDDMSGTNAPVTVASPGNLMWLKLFSDQYENAKGFELFIEERHENGNFSCMIQEFTCTGVNGLICLPQYMKCDGIRFCPDGGSDEEECGQCGAKNIYLFGDTVRNLTSPGYPDEYGDDIDCDWQIIALDSQNILVSIFDFDVERGYDFFSIGDSADITNASTTIASLSGLVKLKTVTSKGPEIWMKFKTDRSGTRRGFFLQLQELPHFNGTGICEETDIDCGLGFCAREDAPCNGYNDCLNFADELGCVNISCPESYKCNPDPSRGVQQCVPLDVICDGTRDCPLGDDELRCDTKRCPRDCECFYEGDRLFTRCLYGWDDITIQNVARTTFSLELSGSNVSALDRGAFKGLAGLESLSLSKNNITRVEPRTFDGLYNLSWLDLSSTQLAVLESQSFEELTLLRGFFLFEVPVEEIEKGAFDGLARLQTLVLVKGDKHRGHIIVEDGGFRGVSGEVQTLYVDDHRLCCFFDGLDECITLEPQPPLFMCGSLMQNTFLRISMWILGLSACLGNMLVIVLRMREKNKHSSRAVHSFLVLNLAVSDFMMGSYMIILSSVDVYYGDRYFEYSDAWRASVVCKLAGFISLLSSEGSVFFITLITLDRFLCIIFPFSQVHLRYTSARVIIGILWVCAITISLVPTLYADPDSDLYDLSDVCIGLPLITRPTDFTTLKSDVGGPDSGGKSFDLPVATDSKPAWYFSIAIFLGINLFCFLIIAVCYTSIFIKVKLSLKDVKRKMGMAEEIKMAMKMAIIVGTDFLCWMPIVIMGILSQTGLAVIPLQMYTWSVVFILPINSSLNPYLYTISSAYAEHKKEQSQSMRMQSMGNSRATKFASENTMHSVMDSTMQPD